MIPGNGQCADCWVEAPEWCSINFGIMICIECSGVHRSMGTHVSKVRSFKLDDFDPEVIDVSSCLFVWWFGWFWSVGRGCESWLPGMQVGVFVGCAACCCLPALCNRTKIQLSTDAPCPRPPTHTPLTHAHYHAHTLTHTRTHTHGTSCSGQWATSGPTRCWRGCAST